MDRKQCHLGHGYPKGAAIKHFKSAAKNFAWYEDRKGFGGFLAYFWLTMNACLRFALDLPAVGRGFVIENGNFLNRVMAEEDRFLKEGHIWGETYLHRACALAQKR